MSKVCIQCNTNKSLDEFSNNSKMVDGKINKCKTCMNQYYKEYNKSRSTKKQEVNQKSLTNYLKYKLYNIIRQDKAKFPNHENTLTIEDLIDIYNKYDGVCVYSNVKLKPNKNANIYKKVSFDRIDNNYPHIKENLQLTSVYMNIFRGKRTHEEFMEELNNCP